MEDSQYLNKYEELEVLNTNSHDNYKLILLRDLADNSYKMAKKISIFQSSDASQDQILNEVKLLKQLHNPHVLKYYDVFLQNDDFIVALEFCEEGDLAYYLKKRKQRKELLSEKLILSWIMQILMGLQYIHSKNIIYRGACSQNIYMNHQGDLKLGSFGHAKVLQNTLEKAMTVVGAPINLSPEIVEGKPYNQKADIWALGCLVFQLATLQHPYQMNNLPQLYELIVKKPTIELPVKYSKYLNPIYKKMMKKNPAHRPSASQLLQEEVFMKLMKEYTKKKKIDALDLRQITPKQLSTHKKKVNSKSPKLVLPPLHPGKTQQNAKLSESHIRKAQRKNSREKTSREKDNEKVKSPVLSKSSSSSKIKKDKQIEVGSSNEKPEKQNRLTKPNLQECEYISVMYQVRLQLLEKKYSPNMSQIFEQTIEFEE